MPSKGRQETRGLETSPIWQQTLGDQGPNDPHSRERALLCAALERLAERANQIADESKRDLPKLPLHDRVHHEAVSSLVGTIAGDNYPLLPTEAFVLRAAILVHDLGLTLAAYPEGEATLRADPRWGDAVAIAHKQIHGHHASAALVASPSEDVARAALEDILLKRHAERAEGLAVDPWRSPEGRADLYLIENEDVRKAFGQLIGRVAASHWWPIKRLASEFAISLTPPPGFPEGWVVDSLKVACLLRTADAAQLDASRTPALTYAVRRPKGISDDHWQFQKRLHRPVHKRGRLKYTTGSSFPPSEQSAWWLCYRSLQMVHHELQAVDSLLAEHNRPQLQARGVAGIETPEDFARFIRTEGWLPRDTRFRVTNVPKVITEHTGRRRRNPDKLTALRELIQNGIDAVKARRLREDLPHGWGQVMVRLIKDGERHWLEVEDNGVGMSPFVLTEYLTDFGASLWGSADIADELPGLAGRGFDSIGTFGSGFYDAFALGDHVSIISRRADAAQSEVYALDFDGVETPPLLRKATANESSRDGGTTVRILLLDHPRQEGGLLYASQSRQRLSLAELCAFAAPGSSVSIDVAEERGGSGRHGRRLDNS
jgi:hypothetical protein